MPTPNEVKKQVLRQYLLAYLNLSISELHPGTDIKLRWFHNVIADAIERTMFGAERRCIINVGPRSLKSQICSVSAVVWALGRNPKLNVMVIAGSRELARDLRDRTWRLLKSARIRALYPGLPIYLRRPDYSVQAWGRGELQRLRPEPDRTGGRYHHP
ncbi:hypothetical protein JNW90_07385 [Micromonospora sp. STR1s_5]|nr:hypothetical protein [Micromonospora sp. STR1s_5]